MIDAAVLIPVYRSQPGELHIVMILRHPGGVHGGQIAFPGGKHDPEDETMLDTAIREVREELGLLIDRADVLAELPVVETRTTGYRVFPYLARIQVPDRWQTCRAGDRGDYRCKAQRSFATGCPRQKDRALFYLATTATGSILPGGLPSALGAFLSHLASGHSATQGRRVGCVSRRFLR